MTRRRHSLTAAVRRAASRAGSGSGVTTAFVVVPFAGLGVAVWLAWGHGLNLAGVLLAAALYMLTGLGVTVGFHRLLTHRSFTAVPVLRVALAIAGSMSFEGEVTGWVAIHRRHHAFTDRPGGPHVFGSRPIATRRHDRATNLWPLALLSFGESWHNMHHSDPACARHGVDPGQVDISAAVIRVFESLGWS
jgi:fatty-acid desaturase